MIISHKFKFIFIKTQKTAGTSIEVFLSGHCAHSDILTPILPIVHPHRPRNYQDQGFYNHMPGREIRTRVPDNVWSGYFKFCVERNPWEKTLSHYHMHKYRAGGELSVNEYFERGDFPRDFNKYTDDSGCLIVDSVLKYERLNEELTYVFEQLGVPFSGSLGVFAKSEYRSDYQPYKDIFSRQQINLIAEIFSKEIAQYNYLV